MSYIWVKEQKVLKEVDMIQESDLMDQVFQK